MFQQDANHFPLPAHDWQVKETHGKAVRQDLLFEIIYQIISVAVSEINIKLRLSAVFIRNRGLYLFAQDDFYVHLRLINHRFKIIGGKKLIMWITGRNGITFAQLLFLSLWRENVRCLLHVFQPCFSRVDGIYKG